MKRLLIVLSFISFSYLQTTAQVLFEPKILILSPGDFAFDQGLKKEVEQKTVELKKMALQALGKSADQKDKENGQPANLKLMQQSTVDFLSQIDFSKEISIFAQQYLTYRFYEKFPNCLILLKDQKSIDSMEGLRKIASDQNMAYVLNFSKISLYKQNGETYCKVNMQLYEQQSNKLLIDKEYTGDWNNPGFEFSCEQGSIGCTINNALSAAMPDVIFQVASNNLTLIRERALAAERSAFIQDSILSKRFDGGPAKKIIGFTNNDIDLGDLFHCFYSADNSKFVAFFIKTLDAKDAKKLLDIKKDENVTVITSKDIKDPGYLDQSPKTYAFIVRGVQYQNKWYTDKSEITYFDAASLEEGKLEYLNNLQKWDFFNENAAEPGPGFWEGQLFEKIKDKRKDPDWEKYKDMWAMDEREDRDYIGLYEIVANKLKEENAAADLSFRKLQIAGLLLPFYQDQVRLKSNHIFKADTPEVFYLIFPKDKHVILNPIKITDEKGIMSIRYFIFIPKTNEVYEWIFPERNVLGKDGYTDEPINKAIGALTVWDLSYKTLDDDNFWNEKVMAKDGAGYKYLKKLQ